MIKTKTVKKEKNTLYEIFYAHGNQIAAAQCKEIIFPSTNDLFLILNEIVYPPDSNLTSLYIPKQWILVIKETLEIKPNNLVVLHPND